MTTLEVHTQSPEITTLSQEIQLPPSKRYPGLFEAMCRAEVCADGIDIADFENKYDDDRVMGMYAKFVAGEYGDMSIKTFAGMVANFPERKPVVPLQRAEGEPKLSLKEHCKKVFFGSVRHAYLNEGSQIGVSKPVLEPGGRFGFPKVGRGRLFYWDMWPTLRVADVEEMREWGVDRIRDTLDNFSELAEKLGGCIPNVNTTWGATRSQPPVLHRIVKLLAKHEGSQAMLDYLPLMERHFGFWRDGADDPNKLGTEPGNAYRRVVRMPNGGIMYRHWDDGEGPRDEMYLEDLKTLEKLKAYKQERGEECTEEDEKRLFKNIRASAESGEDFRIADSSNYKDLFLLRTIDMAPAKLNGLMYEFAVTLSQAYRLKAETCTDLASYEEAIDRAEFYAQDAESLRECILEHNVTDDNFCADYDFVKNTTEPGNALAGVFAIGSGVFSQEDSERMLETIDQRFLRPSGLINTLYEDSDEQWDRNCWPIMQMEAIDAAILHGRYDLALKWAKKLLVNNDKIYELYGILAEKSDPNQTGELGDQGEYECVPDILMTLGVEMAVREMLPWLEEMAAKMPKANPRVAVAAGQLATA